MPSLRISKILQIASEKKSHEERAAFLKANDSEVLQGVLYVIFSPDAPKMCLPEGTPPFKKNEFEDEAELRLYSEWRRVYLFFPNYQMNSAKREYAFIQLLESLHQEDAKLMVGVKDKKCPYKGITLKTCQLAYPNLFPNKSKEAVA